MKTDNCSNISGPRHYGLIGKSLSHSFSKKYFSEKFHHENLDAEYSLFELETVDSIHALVKEKKLCGFNVTIPFKEDIIPMLDGISKEAQGIGAVNTVHVTPTGLIGYNTDVYGFRESIKPFLKRHHRKAMILGTGGASKAVKFALKNLGLDVVMVSRNPKELDEISYADVNDKAVAFFPFIIHCTPLGTYPEINTCPELPYTALTEKNFLFDLVYNPAETLFLKNGAENNAQTMNGLTMLQLQAEKSWEIWTGKAKPE